MKNCCEEMAMFVKSVNSETSKSVRFFDDSPSELYVSTDSLDSVVPNILFRFCPYCGASLVDVEKTGHQFLDELKSKVFPKGIDEKTSLSCRLVILEEALEELQRFVKDELPKFARKLKQ